MDQLQLGVGRALITPKVGCNLMGYRPNVYAESVHDELTATVFWFRQGNLDALMINLTLCNLGTGLYQQILQLLSERFGIGEGAVTVSCTHTHSGPVTMERSVSREDWEEWSHPYVEQRLIPGILQAVESAKGALRPVWMGLATGSSRLGVNRRQPTPDGRVVLGQYPGGSFDPKMTVLSFRTADQRIYANLIHYGCHGTCAGMHTAISRDWSGIMVDRMEEQTGGITAFFNGTAGDTGPRLSNGFTTGKGDFQYVYEAGAVAAEDAARIWNTITDYRAVQLQLADGTVKIPLKPRPTGAEAEECLAKPFEGYSSEQRAYERHYREILESYDADYKEQGEATLHQVLLRLGDVAFYTLPFEPFSGIGLQIQALSKGPQALCLGYTNGSEGYFPTQDQLESGGYEINVFRFRRIQPFVDNGDHFVVHATVENLKKLK